MILKPIVDDSLSITLLSFKYMKLMSLGKMCYLTTMKNHAYILFLLSNSTLFYYFIRVSITVFHFLLLECSLV